MPAKKFVDDARLVGLYESGNSTREVARQLGVSQGFVMRRLHALGVEMRPTCHWDYSPTKHRRRVHQFDIVRAVGMVRAGYSLSRMVRELKRCRKTIVAALAAHGIEVVKHVRPTTAVQELRKAG